MVLSSSWRMDARSALFGFQYILERGWTEVLPMKCCIEIQGGARHVQHISLRSKHRGSATSSVNGRVIQIQPMWSED